MEPETQNQTNNTPVTQSQTENHEKNSVGPLIGSIIVIVVLVIGAIYVWGNKINKEVIPNGSENNTELTPLSTNNDVTSLENDLMNTPDVDLNVDNI